jgi:hypothetical protein
MDNRDILVSIVRHLNLIEVIRLMLVDKNFYNVCFDCYCNLTIKQLIEQFNIKVILNYLAKTNLTKDVINMNKLSEYPTIFMKQVSFSNCHKFKFMTANKRTIVLTICPDGKILMLECKSLLDHKEKMDIFCDLLRQYDIIQKTPVIFEINCTMSTISFHLLHDITEKFKLISQFSKKIIGTIYEMFTVTKIEWKTCFFGINITEIFITVTHKNNTNSRIHIRKSKLVILSGKLRSTEIIVLYKLTHNLMRQI